MDFESIAGMLRGIAIELDGTLPSTDIENAWVLIDAGEPGVALENICMQLLEYEVALPQNLLAQIIAAGEAMHLAPENWTDLTTELVIE